MDGECRYISEVNGTLPDARSITINIMYLDRKERPNGPV